MADRTQAERLQYQWSRTDKPFEARLCMRLTPTRHPARFTTAMHRTLRYALVAMLCLRSVSYSSAKCAQTKSALTSSCEDLCFPGRPCFAFAGSDDEAAVNATCEATNAKLGTCEASKATDCTFLCFKYGVEDQVERNIVDFTRFTFFVPFGDFKSKWELKWDDEDEDEAKKTLTEDDTTTRPSLSNDVLSRIDPLAFLPSTTTLTIAGGTSVVGMRGKVVEMTLEPSVLVEQAGLLDVTLANMKLEQIIANSFPPQLINFTLSNCGLKVFPEDLNKMTGLERLDLSKNYYKTYPAKYGSTSVQFLNVSHNSIESFDGEFPNVTILDLSDNVLTTVPRSVFSMSRLESLDLRLNSFADVELTEEQFEFLGNLSSFAIDSFGTLNCDASLQRSLGKTSVCMAASDTDAVNQDNGSSGSGGSNTSAIIGGVVGGLVGVLIVGAIVYVARVRRGPAEEKPTTTGGGGPVGSTTRSGDSRESHSLWNDQELLSLRIDSNDIEDVRKLGAGAHCIVYLVNYRNSQIAASKRLKKDEANFYNTQHFITEIKLVARLDHPRVLTLIGVAWTIESDLQALFEYMDGGDLRDYIEDSSTSRVWTREKLQIAIDIIEALVYVHSFSPPLLHRDLKSRNVLLDNQRRAKLSDFGIARFRSEVGTMTTGVGTGRWLAPEVISGTNDYDQACDIFAFGAVLSELDTHMLPYEEVRGPSGNRLADVALLQMVAAGKLIPSFSSQSPPELVKLAMRCLSFEPHNRPSAVEVAYSLRTMLASQDTMSV